MLRARSSRGPTYAGERNGWPMFDTLGERPGFTFRDVEQDKGRRDHAGWGRPLTRRNPGCERLEDQALMRLSRVTTTSSRASLVNPAHITYSIAPDGVLWDHGTNDLNAVFNAQVRDGGLGGGDRPGPGHLGIRGQHQSSFRRRRPLRPERAGNCPGRLPFRRYPDRRIYVPRQHDDPVPDVFPPPTVPRRPATSKSTPPRTSTSGGPTTFTASTCMKPAVHSDWTAPTNPAEVMYTNYRGIPHGALGRGHRGHPGNLRQHGRSMTTSGRLGVGFGSAIDVSAGLVEGQTVKLLTNLSFASLGDSEYFSFVATAYASGNIAGHRPRAQHPHAESEVSLYDAAGDPFGRRGMPRRRATTPRRRGRRHSRTEVLRRGLRPDRRCLRAAATRLTVRLPTSHPAPRPPSPTHHGSTSVIDCDQLGVPGSPRGERNVGDRKEPGTGAPGVSPGTRSRPGRISITSPSRPAPAAIPDQCSAESTIQVFTSRGKPWPGENHVSLPGVSGWNLLSPEDLNGKYLGR